MLSRTLRLCCLLAVGLSACAPGSDWVLVDNFETSDRASAWTHIDTQNETDPFVPNAQVSEIISEYGTDNHYLLKKPAADGVVGNRKAISFRALPTDVPVGETYTLYTRIFVDAFPNNHSFGLSNVRAFDLPDEGYDAFEPMIRITDKAKSDGTKNDGTLMALSGYKTYGKITNSATGNPAEPMEPAIWYEIWTVVNNGPADQGGQTYDLYVRGGEFSEQQKVFSGGVFRMQREAPLTAFMAICNTGSKRAPYGNGGVGYDDIYMASGAVLSSPLTQ